MTTARRPGRDDGFTLIETMTSIFIISVVLAAVSSFLVTSMALTSHQGATQVATQFATQATGMVRTMKGSSLTTGRDATSSNAQWSAPVRGTASYLADMTLASDPSAATNAGRTATLPTVPTTATLINDVPFQTHFYVGRCWQPVGGGTCTTSQTGTVASFFRVVVAVTWRGRTCAQSVCSYVTATLVSSAPKEPLFNINNPMAPSLTITHPGNRTGIIGTAATLQMAALNGIVPLTWSFTGLPSGLTGNASGLVSGTLPGTPDAYTVVVSVRDGAAVVDATSFTWTVTRPLPANATGLSHARACTVPVSVPAVRAVTTGSSAASAGYVDVATPATQPGDVLFAVMLSTKSANPVVPAATGWTAAPLRRGGPTAANPASSAASNSAGLYWRAVTPQMPATYRFSWPDATDSGTVLLASYSGVDMGDPFGDAYVTAQSGGTGITGESRPITGAPGVYLLATMATATPPATATAAMTSTDPALTARGTVAAANGAGRIALWDKVHPSNGSTGSPAVNWGASNRPGIAFSAVLRQRGTPYVDPTVNLSWTPPSDTSVTGYQLLRGATTTHLSGRTTSTWSDLTTAAATGYTYTLKSVNAAGAASGVSVTVPACA